MGTDRQRVAVSLPLPNQPLVFQNAASLNARSFEYRDRRRAILIVDDDLGTCETFGLSLSRTGLYVEAVLSGAAALAAARSSTFDLMLLDLRLTDMIGIEVPRALREEGRLVPFVLMSAFHTTETTVEAMRLGAAGVVDKPLTLEDVHRTVSSVLVGGAPSAPSAVPTLRESTAQRDRRPGCIAERWALLVLRACESESDLTTISDWAACVGVSKTSLVETCYLLGVDPRDARDLARLLRVFILSAARDCPVEALLDVSDRRTLRALFQRGGLELALTAAQLSPNQFLERQRFVSAKNEGLKVLTLLVHARERKDYWS